MSTQIHPTAIVSPKAELGNNVSVGPHTIIEDDVVIGDDCEIASSCLLASCARLGARVKVSHSAVIGTQPQDLKFGGEKTLAKIGDETVIREFVTVNRGTKAHGESTIGKKCLLMAYTHVAHDCVIGDRVKMANATNPAGHVTIEDDAVLSGVIGIHQFVRIGKLAMIGGLSRVAVDVPPFVMAAPNPDFTMCGLNLVGLKRHGYSREQIGKIKEAYDVVYHAKLTLKEALAKLEKELAGDEDVDYIISFLQKAERGIVR